MPSLQIPEDLWTLSLLWNPNRLDPFHVGDDFLGHSNRLVQPPILSPNHVCNHFAIIFLLELVVVALDLVLVVGLGVDVGGLFGEVYHLLLLLVLFLDLVALEELVVFLMALEACHGGPLRNLLHYTITVIFRRLNMYFAL